MLPPQLRQQQQHSTLVLGRFHVCVLVSLTPGCCVRSQ